MHFCVAIDRSHESSCNSSKLYLGLFSVLDIGTSCSREMYCDDIDTLKTRWCTIFPDKNGDL